VKHADEFAAKMLGLPDPEFEAELARAVASRRGSPLSEANLRKFVARYAHLPMEKRCTLLGAYVELHLMGRAPKKRGPKVESNLERDKVMTLIVAGLHRYKELSLDEGKNSAYAKVAELFDYEHARDVRRRVHTHAKRFMGLTPAAFRKFAKGLSDSD
jgi:hypothetical protein